MKRADRELAEFKCVRDQEFVVGGYTAPGGSRVGLGACSSGITTVATGLCRQVGTGFDTATLRSLHKQLSDLEQEASPFTRGRFGERDVRWVRPEMVAQIEFCGMDARRQAPSPAICRSAHRQEPRRRGEGDKLMPRIDVEVTHGDRVMG